jgi:drug/metabolite transporter (DMT)-like permease
MAKRDILQFTSPSLSTAATLSLFALVVVAWGLNWTVTKFILTDMTPLWAAAIRTIIAAIVLLPVLALTGQFITHTR